MQPRSARARITVIFEVTRDRPEMDFDDEDLDDESAADDATDEQVETVPHAPFLVMVSKKVSAPHRSPRTRARARRNAPSHQSRLPKLPQGRTPPVRWTGPTWAPSRWSVWRTTATSSSTASR